MVVSIIDHKSGCALRGCPASEGNAGMTEMKKPSEEGSLKCAGPLSIPTSGGDQDTLSAWRHGRYPRRGHRLSRATSQH